MEDVLTREEVIRTSIMTTDEGKKILYDEEKEKVMGVDDLANYNKLTGLPVIRLFFYNASNIVFKKPEGRYGVLVMDITQFKAVNEFLGREGGDRLLLYIGSILKEYAKDRPDTVAGQVRADNFCLFTSYDDEKELADIAMDIKRRVENSGLAFKVILSIGICASREHMPAVSYMKDCATIALATIKGKYYADYCFFTEEMRASMLREKLVESDMMEALEKNEIVPFIQPKVDMITGRIVGGEALARWVHPKKGLVSPGVFIPIIEKTGLVIDVDKKVWEQVFRYQSSVLARGLTPVPISVNISRMHIYDNHLGVVLPEYSRRYGVDAGYIILELTESAFAFDEDKIHGIMNELRKDGYVLSMDDFGSGYSSLNMLKSRELDEVKLDKEFLSDICQPKCRVVVKHLLAMLRELETDVLVEGIETQEQADFLISNGCRKAQGFYYYRPMPMDEFDRLLIRQEETSDG